MSLLVTAVVTGLDATAFTNGDAAMPAISAVAVPVVANPFNAIGNPPIFQQFRQIQQLFLTIYLLLLQSHSIAANLS